jgi:hypothetical protein
MNYLLQVYEDETQIWSDIANFANIYPACKYADQCSKEFTGYGMLRVIDTRTEEVVLSLPTGNK